MSAVQSWLDVQCAMFPGAARAAVLEVGGVDDKAQACACWPGAGDRVPGEFIAIAGAAARGAGVVRSLPEDAGRETGFLVACPIDKATTDGERRVAVVEVRGVASTQHRVVLQILQWGSNWLELLERSGATSDADRLTLLVDFIAGSVQHRRFEHAAMALVTEIAARLDCERVSLGLLRRGRVRVEAVSNSAHVEKRSTLMRQIATAMEEAIDQDATVVHPPLPGAAPLIGFAQEVLAGESGAGVICTTPLLSGDETIGALTLERGALSSFDRGTVELCESLGALLGPVLALKEAQDRSLPRVLWDAGVRSLANVFGPRYLVAKLSTVITVIALVVAASLPVEYRVHAPATLEPNQMRVVAAPQDGFIVSAQARAGDTVSAGQVLATLDQDELEIERRQLQSERGRYAKEQRAALGQGDRAKSAISSARMAEVEARLELVEERLARTHIVAPFDAVVVSGDLSQSLGTPVKDGQALFRVAPQEGYRVRLDVDERDIAELTPGQPGALALTGLPDTRVPLIVERILPVSSPGDGRNIFAVEATLEGDLPLLKPGMSGVAKVTIGERKLMWVWTHTLRDRLRVQLWRWTG